MLKLKARDIVNMETVELWSIPDGPLEVEFDDGVLETNGKATKLSWYFWPFFRLDPEVPICMHHHIGKGHFTKDLQLKVLGRCLFDVYLYRMRKYQQPPVHPIEMFSLMAMQAINRLYNELTYLLEEYVTGLSAEDFLEVIDHPRIKANNALIRDNYESIEAAYIANEKVLKDITAFPNNRLALFVRTGIGSVAQVNQNITAVGYRTAANSKMFGIPLLENFAEGVTSAYGHLIESRSASKAVLYTHSPLQKTQYYNREMQLLACAVTELHHFTNCGTKRTIEFPVRHNKDLAVLDGKWMVLEDGQLELIRPTSKHLIGTTVKYRSVIQCEHPHPTGCCSVCYGELCHSVPNFTNIGSLSIIEVCERISQIVLSTKHLDQNAKLEEFEFHGVEAKYMTIHGVDSKIKLKPWVVPHNPKLRLNAQALPNLALLGLMDDISTLNPDSIGELVSVSLVHDIRDGQTIIPISVSMGSRRAVMTHELMRYLKDVPGKLVSKNEYEIDLVGWDPVKPLLQLPNKHRNMLEYKNTVENFIKAHNEYERRLNKQLSDQDISEALVEFVDIVGAKLTINIVHLETTLYSTMIRAAAQEDYRLPKPYTPREFGKYADIMSRRSLAPAMAYQGHRRVLYDIENFMATERPSSPMDPILAVPVTENVDSVW